MTIKVKSTALSYCKFVLFSIVLSAFTANANEQEAGVREQACKIEDQACLQAPYWSFSLAWGYGAKTNPLKQADNIPLFLVPRWQLEYQNFFIDNLDIGYALNQSSQSGLVVLLTPNLDGLYFNQSHFLNAVATSIPSGQSGVGVGGELSDIILFDDVERDFSYYLGLEWHKKSNQHKIAIQSLFDVSGVHDGAELRLNYSYRSQSDSAIFVPSIGVAWRNSKVNNYYYGVTEADLNVVRDSDSSSLNHLLYHAGSGANVYLGFDLVRPITQNTAFLFKLGAEFLPKSVRKSPLIESDVVFTGFIGALTQF